MSVSKQHKKEYNKRYREEYREEIRTYQREYKRKQRGSLAFRKKELECLHKYRQRLDIKEKQSNPEHRERTYERIRKYRQTEKGKQTVRMFVKNRQHRKRANGGITITTSQWETIIHKYNYRCAYCGKLCSLTMDCVIPLSKGGTYSPENIVPACVECNSRKQAELNWKPKIFKRVI